MSAILKEIEYKMDSKLSNKLKVLRNEVGMRQEDVADAIELSRLFAEGFEGIFNKRLIKRRLFDQYIEQEYSI